jgi:5-methylcytosine-specific restriction endonuclease McrA
MRPFTIISTMTEAKIKPLTMNVSRREWKRWYDLASWRRRRAFQLQVHPLCVLCEREGRTTEATIADHVVSHEGDWNRFVLGELQSLCVECHNRKSAGGVSRGYSDAIDPATGFPLDPAHPFNRRR